MVADDAGLRQVMDVKTTVDDTRVARIRGKEDVVDIRWL
jgi:hypothetical protein